MTDQSKEPSNAFVRRRGRRRKWASDAERKRFERFQTRQRKHSCRLKTDVPLMTAGRYIEGAPHAKGLLVTGGYDSEKIASVSHASERSWSGRTVRPRGSGSTDGMSIGQDEEPIGTREWKEHDWTFQDRHPVTADQRSKPLEPSTVKKLLCRTHSGMVGQYTDGFGSPLPVPVVRAQRDWTFELECGCFRYRDIRQCWELTDAA
jgi:hypothetical protein